MTMMKTKTMTKKEYYAKNYSTSHARNGGRPYVPSDIQRLTVHEPCFYCGAARECRHRKAVW
jgi:hypothetical protein